MRKKFLQCLFILSLLVTEGLSAQAAGSSTMSLDAPSYSTSRGETFEVTVNVDPRGEALDTVRGVVTFNPEVLDVQSIRLSGRFDRVAPGNYYDNDTGIISWGAFTLEDPVTTQTSLLTITFLGVAVGEGNLEISDDSRAISDGEEKIDTGSLGEASVTVTESEQTQAGVAILVVDSSTHSDEQSWYISREVKLSWTELEGESAMSAYYYSFGLESDAQPSTYLSRSTRELSLTAQQDGLYYFRIKGVQQNGRETEIEERMVRVDATAPNPIDLSVQDEKILEGESAWFLFATTDETSGVVEYQVAINNSEFQTQTSPLEMEDLEPGTYFFRVAALDRAGNVIYGGTSVRVYPQGTDLDRAQGYEQSGEVQALSAQEQESESEQPQSKTLLITIVLGVIAFFGIIYLARRRKH